VTAVEAGVSSGAAIVVHDDEDAIAVSAYYNDGEEKYENRMRINFDPALDLTDYTTLSLRTNMDNNFSYISLFTTVEDSDDAYTMITNWHGTQSNWYDWSYTLADQPTEGWGGTAWPSTSRQLTGIQFWSDKEGIDTTAYIADIIFE
jgi:hypothetical protein